MQIEQEEKLALASISAAVLGIGHHWLHTSGTHVDLPGGTEVMSVTLGVAALAFAGVYLNCHLRGADY